MLTQAVFLLEGERSRQGITENQRPRPLQPVGGIAFLRRLTDEVARFGVVEMILIASDDWPWENFVAENSDRSYRLRLSAEGAGTCGAMRSAADLLDRRFFLLDGHSFFGATA